MSMAPTRTNVLIVVAALAAVVLIIPHASHIFPTDQPKIADQAVLTFLSAQS